MDTLILRIFLILRKFPMIQQNSKKNSKNKKILRIRMLVNTGPGVIGILPQVELSITP